MNTGNISEALQLLVIGMATVFFILLIVIYFGKLLICLVNKFAPEEEMKPTHKSAAAQTVIDSETMSVIQAVVNQITGGKGKVKNVS